MSLWFALHGDDVGMTSLCSHRVRIALMTSPCSGRDIIAMRESSLQSWRVTDRLFARQADHSPMTLASWRTTSRLMCNLRVFSRQADLHT